MSVVQASTLKTRTLTETRTINAQAGFDTYGSFQGAAWYFALTRLSEPLFQFFKVNQQYFFLITLCLHFASFVVYAINFANAANKNAGKAANLAYRGFIFCFYLAIIAGALLIAPVVGSTMYFVFCTIDPLINFIKASYFMVKCFLAKTKEEREFFYGKSLTAVKFAIGGGLFGMVMILLFSVPGIPLLVTATLGIFFSAATILLAPLIRPWVEKGIGKIMAFFKGEVQEKPPEKSESHDSSLNLDQSGFYSHSVILKMLRPDRLLDKIVHLRQGLEFVIKPKESANFFDKLLSERTKRQNKVLVLNLLEDLISKRDHMPEAAIAQALTLWDGKNKYDFYYADKTEFVEKFHQHVLSQYAGAYQSWANDIGRVHACVHQTLDLVISPHRF